MKDSRFTQNIVIFNCLPSKTTSSLQMWRKHQPLKLVSAGDYGRRKRGLSYLGDYFKLLPVYTTNQYWCFQEGFVVKPLSQRNKIEMLRYRL